MSSATELIKPLTLDDVYAAYITCTFGPHFIFAIGYSVVIASILLCILVGMNGDRVWNVNGGGGGGGSGGGGGGGGMGSGGGGGGDKNNNNRGYKRPVSPSWPTSPNKRDKLDRPDKNGKK